MAKARVAVVVHAEKTVFPPLEENKQRNTKEIGEKAHLLARRGWSRAARPGKQPPRTEKREKKLIIKLNF